MVNDEFSLHKKEPTSLGRHKLGWIARASVRVKAQQAQPNQNDGSTRVDWVGVNLA